MDFIPPAEISGKIMTLIDQADKELILVSPFNKIGKWGKLTTRIKSALKRGVTIHWYVREGAKNNDLDQIEALGIQPIPVKNLHAKLYLNESHAVVSSMNLHQFSDSSSIDIGYWVDETNKLEELKTFIDMYLPIPETEDFFEILQSYLTKYQDHCKEIKTHKSRYGISITLVGFLKKFDLVLEPKGSYFRIDLQTTGSRKEKKELYVFVEHRLVGLERLSGLKVNLGVDMLRFKIDLKLHESYTYETWGRKELQTLKIPVDKWVDSCIKMLKEKMPD